MASFNFEQTGLNKAKRARTIYNCDECQEELDGYRAKLNHDRYHHGMNATDSDDNKVLSNEEASNKENEDNEAQDVTNEEYMSLSDAGMVNDIYINLGQEDTTFSGERTFESIQKMLRTPYKTSGVFNTEGDEESSCVYQDSGSYSGMTKAELYSVQLYDIMQSFSVPREAHRMIVRLMNSTIAGYETMMAEKPESRIMHLEAVQQLLSRKSEFKAQSYNVCSNGCYLFNLNDNANQCPVCGWDRCTEKEISNKSLPVPKIKLLSIGDVLSKLLSNETTREQLLYRSQYQQSTDNSYRDYFDRSAYRDCLDKGMFTSENDQAVALYVDGFVNSKRGSVKYTMIHLVLLNFSPEIRYKTNYHIQLGIVASKNKTAIDSFLQPILSELHYLEENGMTVVKQDGTRLSAKCYMVFLGGDIPGLAAISKAPSHQSRHGCKDCTQVGVHAVNRPNGLYLPYENPSRCRLRTTNDYRHGDPEHGINTISLLSGMKLFNGAAFSTMDELHTIGRGVGMLLLDVLTVAATKENKYYHKLYLNKDVYSTQQYPFFIQKSRLELIGKAIEDSRQHIPTSFLGSCTNQIVNRQGMRAVDVMDYLLYYIPTLFVPELASIPAQQAVLRLIKGCSLALSWSLSDNALDEMDSCFKAFYNFYNKEIALGNLSASIYRPVLHYLQHISSTIKCHGPLPVSSCRSLERTIGLYKRKMSSRTSNQAQPSNLIEKAMLRSLLSHGIDVEEEAKLFRPLGYTEDTWDENEETGRQLWIPFEDVTLTDDESLFEGVKVSALRRALSKYYQRFYGAKDVVVDGPILFKLAGRAWISNKVIVASTVYARKNREHRRANHHVFFTSPFLSSKNVSSRGWYAGTVIYFLKHDYRDNTQFLALVEVMKVNTTAKHSKAIPVVRSARSSETSKYAIISVDQDILYQVGLVKNLGSEHKFSVIVPNNTFDGNVLSTTSGLLANL